MLPGYCVAGTIGHKLMSGKPTKIDLDKDTRIDVRCQIHQLSFSPHTDSKGIMDLVRFLSPKNVILVHGEKPKMGTLKSKIETDLGIQCHVPANHETVYINSTRFEKADATDSFLRSCKNPNFRFSTISLESKSPMVLQNSIEASHLHVSDERVAEGILVTEKSKRPKVVHQDELLHMLGERKHEIQFAKCIPVHFGSFQETRDRSPVPVGNMIGPSTESSQLQHLFTELLNHFPGMRILDNGGHLQIESLRVSICSNNNCPYRTADVPPETTACFCCSWSVEDEKLVWEIISRMESLSQRAE